MPPLLQSASYIGRFAPSPTGPLHSGSLIAALASFLDARSAQGKWLIRIEDTDPPREQTGASTEILRALDAHQLHWDDEVVYQSQRSAIYQAATRSLIEQQQAFYCSCSRLQLKHHDIYPGTCRQQSQPTTLPASVRILCQNSRIVFEDRIQGRQSQNLSQDIGDFVIFRKDGLPAYQLATAIDDAEQGITHVMRGHDLLDSTPRQIYLQQRLQMTSPSYAHIPVLAKKDGQKLSKQNLAAPLIYDSPTACSNNLLQALKILQQDPPNDLQQQCSADILAWAVSHWAPQHIPAIPAIKKDQPDFTASI
jgi:glutamyl-Q tRNA(Asp) synthetase